MIPDNFMELPVEDREKVWSKALEESTMEELGYYKVFTEEAGWHYPMNFNVETGQMEYSPYGLGKGRSGGMKDPSSGKYRTTNELNRGAGLTWDYTTRTWIPKYTDEEKKNAVIALDNRIANLVHRLYDQNNDTIETDRGTEPSSKWINNYIDNVLDWSELDLDTRGVIEAYKTNPDESGRAMEIWQMLPEMRAAFATGAHLNKEEIKYPTYQDEWDYSSSVPVTDSEAMAVKRQEFENDHLQEADKDKAEVQKVRTARINSGTVAAKDAADRILIDNHGWTIKDFQKAGFFLSADIKKYLETLEAAAESASEPVHIDDDILRYLTKEEAEELIKSEPERMREILEGSKDPSGIGFMPKVGPTPSSSDQTTMNLITEDDIDELFKTLDAEDKVTDAPEEEEELDEIDRLVKKLFDPKSSPLPAIANRAQLDAKMRTETTDLMRTVIDASVEAVDFDMYSLDDYKLSIVEEFNDKYGTEYERWGQLTRAFFEGNLSFNQDQFVLEMYDFAKKLVGEGGPGGGGGSAVTSATNIDHETGNNIKGVQNNPSKIAASQVLFGFSEDEATWNELVNERGRKYNNFWQEYDGMSKGYSIFLMNKADQLRSLGADDEAIEKYISAQPSFDEMVQMVRTGNIDFFASGNWAEFAGLEYAARIVNNPSTSNDANLLTQVQRGISFVQNISGDFDKERLAGVTRFLMGLKNGMESTGNYGLYFDILSKAGGGKLQGLAMHWIIYTLNTKSGGNWASLDPNDVNAAITSLPANLMDIIAAGQAIAGMGGENFGGALDASVIDDIHSMNSAFDGMLFPSSEAIEWALGKYDGTPSDSELIRFGNELRSGLDEALSVMSMLVPTSGPRYEAMKDWQYSGLDMWGAFAPTDTDAMLREIWMTIKDTSIGKQVLDIVGHDINDTDFDYDQSGILTLGLGSSGEPIQTWESLLMSALQIITSTPESLDMFKGALTTGIIAQHYLHRDFDLESVFQLYDTYMSHTGGQIIATHISEDGTRNFERIPSNSFTEYIAPTEEKDTYQLTMDAWNALTTVGEGVHATTSVSQADREKNVHDALTRNYGTNFNNMYTEAPIDPKHLEKVLHHVKTVVIPDIENKSKTGAKVGLAEQHMLVARELFQGQFKIDNLPLELEIIGQLANRVIEEYDGIEHLTFTIDPRTNALTQDIRGVRDNPCVVINISEVQELVAPRLMGLLEGVQRKENIMEIRLPWMQLDNADFGNIKSKDVLEEDKLATGYNYWLAQDWMQNVIGKGLYGEIRQVYGEGQIEYRFSNPHKQIKHTAKEHGKFYPYVTPGQFDLVRIKKKDTK